MGIFSPKRYENGEWRRLHNEELHSLYRSPNIVRVIKSRSLRWAGHGAMGCGQKSFKASVAVPALLSEFLANGHLPRVFRQSRL